MYTNMADRQLATRLRTIRRARGETLRDAAAAIGISASTLSRLEAARRRPSSETLRSLCEHYECTPRHLYGDDACRQGRSRGIPDDVALAPAAGSTQRPQEAPRTNDLSGLLGIMEPAPNDSPELLGFAENALDTAMRNLNVVLAVEGDVERYRACREVAKLACSPLDALKHIATDDGSCSVRGAAAQLLTVLAEAYCVFD